MTKTIEHITEEIVNEANDNKDYCHLVLDDEPVTLCLLSLKTFSGIFLRYSSINDIDRSICNCARERCPKCLEIYNALFPEGNHPSFLNSHH